MAISAVDSAILGVALLGAFIYGWLCRAAGASKERKQWLATLESCPKPGCPRRPSGLYFGRTPPLEADESASIWIVVDVGCLEGQYGTELVGVFRLVERADAAAAALRDDDTSHEVQIFGPILLAAL